MRRGISLFDFLSLQGFGLSILPVWAAEAFERIAIEVGEASETPEFRCWTGTLPADEFLVSILGTRTIGIERLGWSLIETRSAVADAPEVEGPPIGREWRVSLQGIALEIPEEWGLPLHAAKEVSAQGTDPRYLARVDGVRTALRGDLHFAVSQVDGEDLRFGLTGPDDPMVARAGEGAVATAALVPPAAVFSPKADGFGIVVDRITVDNSLNTTPPEIAGADPDWTGLRLERAAIYLPHSIPIIGNLSIEARELLIPTGDTPGGLTGEVSIETGRIAGSGLTLTVRQGAKVLEVSREAGHRFVVLYDRQFDTNGVELPAALHAEAPRKGDWELIEDGAVIKPERGTRSFPQFMPWAGIRLRYTANERVPNNVKFELLKDGVTQGPTRYPLPPQELRFVGAGRPPGLKLSVDVVPPGETIARGNVMHVTGSAALLSQCKFQLGLPSGASEDDLPDDIMWSVWLEGSLPGTGKALVPAAGQGREFSWDGWVPEQAVSIIATFTQPGREGQRPRQVERRVLITPSASGHLLFGYNDERGAGARPRILRVAENGRSETLVQPEDFAAEGWAKTYLQTVQHDPGFTLADGAPIPARLPDGSGVFPIATEEALVVPVRQVPVPKEQTTPPETPQSEPETFTTKRVLTVFYDSSYPLVMLNDGPRRWSHDKGPKEWLSASKLSVSDETFGTVQRAPAPPTAATTGRTVAMLAKWLRQQNVDEEKNPVLFVVAHTSPEDKKADNEKLAISRRDVGLNFARLAAKAAGLTLDIRGRGEHKDRRPDEPEYGTGISDPPKKSAAPHDSEQRTRPDKWARHGQMGDADTGPGDNTTDLWIGFRGDMHKPVFLIERNITFILKGTRRSEPPKPKPEETETEVIPPFVPVLVPGPEGTLALQDGAPSGGADTPWRLRARAVWDAPVYSGRDDLVPNLVEVEVAFPKSILPGIDEDEEGTFSILGRVERDRFLDEVTARLGVSVTDNPTGLWEFKSEDVGGHAGIAAALFGPLLAKQAADDSPPDNPREDEGLDSATQLDVAAGIGAAGIFAANMTAGRFVWTAASVEATVPGIRTGFAIDYLAEAQVNIDDFVFTTEPVAVAWSNVGIKADWRPLLQDEAPKLSVTGMGADFGQARSDVISAGRWTIAGALDGFLDVTDIELRWSSLELSATLVPTKPLGGVKLEAIGLRAKWGEDIDPSPSVSVTRIRASYDLKEVISATGELDLDGGIAGELDLRVIPAGIAGRAEFAVREPEEGKSGPPMVQLGATLRFATPVPLGGSGLALVGVQGRVVANGTRNLPDHADIIQQELGWARLGALQKYTQEAGQHAVGFGALLGTAPDAGFMLNASGMLTLAFPEIEVALTAELAFVSLPKGIPTDEGVADDEELPAETADVLAILVASKRGVTLAAEGTVEIPFQMRAHIPIGAHFPTNGDPFYIRFGSDGYAGTTETAPRPGQPVTATLYPGLVDLDGWAFVMIEEGGLPDLGGARAEGLDLAGFSVGMGLGFDLSRSFGPFRLRAYAQVIAGLGLEPLLVSADLQLGGELDFGIASVHVAGKIQVTFTQDYLELDGSVTGRISFLFFDLEGTAHIRERLGQNATLPASPSLLRRLSFVDQQDAELGNADAGTVADNVPVDAAIRMLFGTTPLITKDAADGFVIAGAAGATPEWTGSSNMRHAYRIDSIRLTRAGQEPVPGANGPLPATVIEPPRDTPEGSQAGTAMQLALLSSDPLPWLGNVDPGDDTTADRVNELAGTVCELGSLPKGAEGQALWGVDMGRRNIARWTGRSRGARQWSFIGHAELSALGMQQLAPSLQAELGLEVAPQGVETLAGLRALCAGTQVEVGGFANVPATPLGLPEGALIFPHLMRRGIISGSLPTEIRLDQPVVDPVATFLVDGQSLANAQSLAEHRKICAQGPDPFRGRRTKAKADNVSYVTESPGFSVRDAGAIHTLSLETSTAVSRRSLQISFDVAKARPTIGVDLGMLGRGRSSIGREARLLIIARARDGRMLFSTSRRSRQQGSGDPNRPENQIEIPRDDVSSIELQVRDGRIVVSPPCWTEVEKVMDHVPRPRIWGLRTDGRWEGWEVTPAGSTGLRNGAFMMRAAPESRGAAFTAIFASAQPRGWLALQDLAATTLAARQAQAAEGVRRAARRSHFGGRVPEDARPTTPEGISGEIAVRDTVPAGARKPLLVAGAQYDIELQYTVARWTRQSDDDTPPPVADAFAQTQAITLLPQVTERMAFRTQPSNDAVTAAARAFDRALPTDTRGRHYTDDPMAVVFNTDLVPDLLALADYRLSFRIRRIDAQGGGAVVPSENISLTRANGRQASWRGLESELSDAIEKTACIPAAPIRGESMVLTAPLDPDAAYALEIYAEKAGAEIVEIGETRFGTSRYTGPGAQLAALGLATDPASAQMLPERLVSIAPKIGALKPLDSVYEQAALALGLDIAPSPYARAEALYQLTADGWRLVGIHLRSPEPLERAEEVFMPGGVLRNETRLGLETVVVSINGQEHALQPAVRDASGARWIYAPVQPIAMTDTAALTVMLQQAGGVWVNGVLRPRDRQISFHADLRPIPAIAEREGLI